MMSIKDVINTCKSGDILGNRNWQYNVTVTIKEIKEDEVIVEGAALVTSPHSYLLKNHPDHWKTWQKRE